VAIQVYLDGTDRSSYLYGGFSFDHVKRNKNYRPAIGVADIRFNGATTKTWLNRGVKVHIYYDGSVRFIGIIKNTTYDWDSRSYYCEVESHLAKLQNYVVEYDTLFTAIATGTGDQYTASDSQGYPFVQIIFLMKKLFTVAGMLLDTSEIDNTVWASSTYWTPIYPYDIYYHKLRMDLNMLWCLNQPYSTQHDNIDSVTLTENYSDNKLNFFDLLSELCSLFGFSISPNPTYSATPSFILHKFISTKATRNYTVADSDKFSFEQIDIEPDIPSAEGYNYSWIAGKWDYSSGYHSTTVRQWYADVNNEYQPREYHEGTGLHGLYVMQHLMVFIGDRTVSSTTVSGIYMKLGTMLSNELLSRWGLHTETRIETSPVFTKPCVLNNKIEVTKEKLVSKIRQEDIGEYAHW
jgi:hypothetical protein